MQRRLITLIFFSLLPFLSVQSQNKSRIDSLSRLLTLTAAEDTGKVIVLSLLCDEHGTFNPDKALDYGRQGLLLAKKLKFERGVAICLNSLGIVYFNKGDYKEAVGYYWEALKINEGSGNKKAMADNLGNIGTIYRSQGSYEKALMYSFQALKIDEESGNKSSMAVCYTNIGNIYFEYENYNKALRYYKMALASFESLSDKQNTATALNNIGAIYFTQGDFAKAIDNFNLAIRHFEEVGDKVGVAIDLNNIGQVYYRQTEYRKAIQYYNKSLDLAKRIGAKNTIKHNYECLSEISEKMNDYKSAFEYHKLYAEIKDTLLNAQINKQIDEMAVKYETEKKEKENALLKKETTKQHTLNQRQRTTLNYLMLGLIVISGTGLMFFVRSRTRKKANQYLQELVELKIQEENELRKAKSAVEQSMKLKEQFLANISHEIRTPLNAIIGFTELLHKGSLGTNEKEYIHFIKTAGENLINIVNDILDMSKIEAGRIIFEEKPVSIPELFKSLKILLEHKAVEKGLELSFHCDEKVPKLITGDPTRLTQIFINLVGNAIKFTEFGNIKTTAQLLREENGYLVLEFTVEDTGIGISAEKLGFIFERFTQAEAATTRKYGGTGLGLSIVKHLVELQNGNIFVESEVNKGTKFTFSIPFKPAEQKSEEASISKERPQLNGIKILLAEDNILNVKLIAAIFAGTGARLQITGNGQEAIEQLEKENYDIVLMDMQMPVMDGYQATTYIREKMRSNIPIIAITAHAMTGEKEKCLRLGMNDYVPKPINANVLFDKISFLTYSGPKPSQDEAEAASKLVNLSYLADMLGIKSTSIKEMLDDFAEQMETDLPSLHKAAAEEDYLTLENLSHKLKTPASMLGILPMEEILITIEKQAALKGGIDEIRTCLRKLQSVFQKVLKEIETEKAQL